MEVTIRGRNVEVTDRLRAAAEEKIARLSRHHEGWEHAEVNFFEERNPRISAKEVCEATLRGHGRIIRAKAASTDAASKVPSAANARSSAACNGMPSASQPCTVCASR